MGVIVVTGVPGIGKSTVMEKASKVKDIEIVNYGSVMFETAQKFGIRKRDEMRKLDPEKQRMVQEKAAEKIHEMGDVILDTHCTIKTPKGYLPGLPEWVLKKLKPEVIVLVEATPQEIAGRRQKDKSRDRDKEMIGEIEEHQMINRYTSMAYSTVCGATVRIINNHDNRVEEAAEALISVIK